MRNFLLRKAFMQNYTIASSQPYNRCELCPRACKVNRENGKLGICGVSASLKVARAALHFWEETCISGTKGSGAVFFSGCSMRCVFCQNREIAQGNVGKLSKRPLYFLFVGRKIFFGSVSYARRVGNLSAGKINPEK